MSDRLSQRHRRKYVFGISRRRWIVKPSLENGVGQQSSCNTTVAYMHRNYLNSWLIPVILSSESRVIPSKTVVGECVFLCHRRNQQKSSSQEDVFSEASRYEEHELDVHIKRSFSILNLRKIEQCLDTRNSVYAIGRQGTHRKK